MTDNKPLSKEEILNREIGAYSVRFPNYLHDGYLKAMDEYAKQEAIGFIKFCVDGSYDKVAGDYDGVVNFQLPPEELYSLYFKSKENIEP